MAGKVSKRAAGTPPVTKPAKSPVLVVPCFNEEQRLGDAGFQTLLPKARKFEILFVDDGSRDQTLSLVRKMAENLKFPPPLALPQNRGKAEAVRQGMLAAIAAGATVAGYFDADRSTPVSEAERLLAYFPPHVEVLLGARVKMLGYHIGRSPLRHYLGRVFATAASNCLGIPVYDTQCGMKWFRVTPALKEALSEPFHSRWGFDVELLGRLLKGKDQPGIPISRCEEVPLRVWDEIPGSKLKPLDMPKTLLDMWTIYRALRRWGGG